MQQRSQWRAIDPRMQTSAPRVAINGAPVTATVSKRVLVGGGIAILLVGLLVGFRFGYREVSPLQARLSATQQEVEQVQGELTAATRQAQELDSQLAELTRSNDGKREIGQISEFASKGQWDVAIGLAEGALAAQIKPLSEEAKRSISTLWYGASMDRLYTTVRPSWSDAAIEGQIVGRWLAIERQADTYSLPKERRWSSMSVATRAYTAGIWALADAAFRRAWTAGEAGDVPIGFRYALLRNWGYELAFRGSPAQRDQAIRLLGTAVAIAQSHPVGQEACDDLKRLERVMNLD